MRFKVYSLDVWGHASDECCSSYGCPCVHEHSDECTDPDDCDCEETHDDCSCECSFDINDRCRVGEVEIPDGADDACILNLLNSEGFIHADKCEIDDYSDGSTFEVVACSNHKPLLTLESCE